MKGFNFSYWVGKVLTLVAFVAPVLFQLLPSGWENVTLGVLLHGVVDWINQTYHKA